jgi:hypothetical protein
MRIRYTIDLMTEGKDGIPSFNVLGWTFTFSSTMIPACHTFS